MNDRGTRADSHNRLRSLFLGGIVAFAIWVANAFQEDHVATQLAGILVAAFGIYPSYLWCCGRAGGVPVFPGIALAYVPTYAMPLIQLHTAVLRYEDNEAVRAGLTMAGFLGLATWTWIAALRRQSCPPVYTALALNPDKGQGYLIGFLFGAVLAEMSVLANWFSGSTIVTFLRSIGLALGTLAVMCLAYSAGSGRLNARGKTLFSVLLLALMAAQTASLYLSKSFLVMLSGSVAYVTASRRLPVLWIVGVMGVALFLHPGKSAMRARYWDTGVAIGPEDYPEFYSRWLDESLKATTEQSAEEGAGQGTERAGIIHMVMLVQRASPEKKPFLMGETLEHIPEMLIPRAVHPDKPEVHVGQKKMSIYYGLQTAKEAEVTSIAFGLPAEAYANFGYVGVGALGLLIGWGCGAVTRFGFLADKLTARTLLAFAFCGVLINGERNMAVVCTMLCQTGICIVALSYFIMKKQMVTPIKLFENGFRS